MAHLPLTLPYVLLSRWLLEPQETFLGGSFLLFIMISTYSIVGYLKNARKHIKQKTVPHNAPAQRQWCVYTTILLHFLLLLLYSCAHTTFSKTKVELYCPFCSSSTFFLTLLLSIFSNFYRKIRKIIINPSINNHLTLKIFISWTKLSHLYPFHHLPDTSLPLYVWISGRREFFSFFVQHSHNTIIPLAYLKNNNNFLKS